MSIIYRTLYIIFSIYLLIRSISYSIYEYKNEENKYGSICFLLLVIFTITISNIYVFLNI